MEQITKINFPNKGNQLDLSRGSPRYLGLFCCSRYNSESYRLYQPRISLYLLFYHLPNRKPYHKAKTRQIPLKSLYMRFKPYRCLSLYATTLPITCGRADPYSNNSFPTISLYIALDVV